MTPLHLIDPDDAQLNEAFALHVAGWKRLDYIDGGPWFKNPTDREPSNSVFYTFTTSADAGLPYLNRWEWSASGGAFPTAFVTLRKPITPTRDNSAIHGESDTFPRAAVLALLKAHGVTVEFSQPK